MYFAGIAQLGERQTEDLKVPGSIPGHGTILFLLSVILYYKTETVTFFYISFTIVFISLPEILVKYNK